MYTFIEYMFPPIIFESVSADLIKLDEDRYLIYIDKERMVADEVFTKMRCFSAIVKKDIRDLSQDFFKLAKDEECTADLYETNYNKEIDDAMKKVACIYVNDMSHISFLLPSQISEGNITFVSYMCQH